MRFLICILTTVVCLTANSAQPLRPSTKPLTPATSTVQASATNRVNFSTRRLSNSSATEATLRELFRGTVRLLANDAVEFSYAFSMPNQFDDFASNVGNDAPGFTNGVWEIRDGFLQKSVPDSAPIFHRARFVGPVTVSYKAALIQGQQYASGYLATNGSSQLQAVVAGQPLAMFLAANGKVVADASDAPLGGKMQELLVNFGQNNFSITPAGGKTLTATCQVSEIGQVFLNAAKSSVAFDDLKITGVLDIDWYRQSIDATLTKAYIGRTGPRYGPPPATETQLRQMIKGFQRLLPDGKIELGYDFSDPLQFSDWQVIDARGRADPFAWRVYDGMVRKSQFGPTIMVLQPPLVGPIKISARAAIVSGSEVSIGLRDMEAGVRGGYKLGNMGYFLGEDRGPQKTGASTGILLNQLHTLELTRDDEKVTAKLNDGALLTASMKRFEPFFVLLASTDSTAAFDDVKATGFLDYDWCVKQLKLHGYAEAKLPGQLTGTGRKAEMGKLAQSVAFSSSSRFKVQSTADWQSTRIMLRKGDQMIFSASGSYQYDRSASASSGPEGIQDATKRPPCAKLTPCALVGRIGFGEPFLIGAQAQLVAGEMGELALRINEQPLHDNGGALDVEIVVVPAAK